jgi:predicted MFS family arabinose efflux permease
VFGLLAFLQGVSEPTEGLVAQPVRSLLSGLGQGAGRVATFSAIVGLPWALKPLLGLLTDFLPLGRSRRKSYVIAAGLVATVAFLVLARGAGPAGLLAGLFLATLAAAMADVSTDALVVDCGRADGQTGRYQAATWFCLYASGVVTGALGGVVSEQGRIRDAFVLCALCSAGMVAVAVCVVREPVRDLDLPRVGLASIARSLGRAARSRAVLSVAAFSAVANFNPFTSTILHLHMTGELRHGEQFFGATISILSLASMGAAAAYGFYCRRVPMPVLARTSVLLGVIGTVVYAAMGDQRSAVLVTAVVGFTSMSATLVQFELAARACPREAAGTVFASFMAVSNLSTSLATWLGGIWYEAAGATWGRPAAFQGLIVAAAAITAAGWWIVPWMPAELLARTEPSS